MVQLPSKGKTILNDNMQRGDCTMRKWKKWMGVICAAGLAAAMSFASLAENGQGALPAACFDGTVASMEDGRFIMNRVLESGTEEVVINLTEETLILDAVNGFPAGADSLKEGESVRVYAGPAMTMSLPPITNAELVFTGIPADAVVPSYETVTSLTANGDGTYTVETLAGNQYAVSGETILLPYLTRNMVFAENLQPGVKFLVWPAADGGQNAYKIVIFQGENGYGAGNGETAERHGWLEESDGWYYYDQGQKKTGWFWDGSDWFYLDPETGRMETGFATVDGKTYYLNEDGRMLTEARVFTPDESGALH